ncbi:MAG: alpha-N-acetylglucosaminidase C-terminal domain-containing protein [Spirochaetales bacterium]|nr:alpha-N-acetylglucosaminidase C-terminal domain-containing protein [Spirochaetales bacterium]
MLKKNILVAICFFIAFSLASALEIEKSEVAVAEDLVHRIVGDHFSSFKVLIEFDSIEEQDFFCIKSENNQVVISGNSVISVAVGLNYYLKEFCDVNVSWYVDESYEIPETLDFNFEPIKRSTELKKRFFLNYCTFGYTMAFWSWFEWEHFIDWMALNGINLPLAITGREKIWYEISKDLGIGEDDILEYFSGPAFFPWFRMGNFEKWKGGVSLDFIEKSSSLQKQIVSRQRELGMTSVLPAFSGHVPSKFIEIFPDADISVLEPWGGFPVEYSTYFLSPEDPLFAKIQKLFLEKQIELYGTDHIYGVDPFNEMKPPSWDSSYLSSVTSYIYDSLYSVDKDAVWLQMGWLFFHSRGNWTNERIEASLSSVPQGKMMLLDYYCENIEVWKITEAFFSQPYLWCYLGNFGGKPDLLGSLRNLDKKLNYLFSSSSKGNLIGVGSTLEGFDSNRFLYEYLFEKIWDPVEVTPEYFIKRRTCINGKVDLNYLSAWNQLIDNIYLSDSDYICQGSLHRARPNLSGNSIWNRYKEKRYEFHDIVHVWDAIVKSEREVLETATGEYDLINITRQVLCDFEPEILKSIKKYYYLRNYKKVREFSDLYLEVLDDLSLLTSYRPEWSLDKWIEKAEKFAENEEEKKYLKDNALHLITRWGPDDYTALWDYSSRDFSGLINGYYRQRWIIFLDSICESVRKLRYINSKNVQLQIDDFEKRWLKNPVYEERKPAMLPYDFVQSLYLKYRDNINYQK